MMQSKKFAVTGGIGSGKSTVCEILRSLGYPVYSCDDISRAMWGDAAYLVELARLFPTCTVEGRMDKKRLSALVFSDEEARKRLEAFSHPRILDELLRRMGEHPLSFGEVPLLFEGGYQTLFDGVFLVVRGEEERIRSAAMRDGVERSEIEKRVRAQLPDEEKRGENVYLIENNAAEDALRPAVLSALSAAGLR